jgi:hypothetical protein
MPICFLDALRRLHRIAQALARSHVEADTVAGKLPLMPDRQLRRDCSQCARLLSGTCVPLADFT